MIRRRSRFDGEDEQQPEFQISTMCDILMSMLVFFVATATKEVLQPPADVTLPDVAHEEPRTKDQFKIYIEGYLGNTSILTGREGNSVKYESADELIQPLKDDYQAYLATEKLRGVSANEAGGHYRVAISADQEVAYSTVRAVMKACGKAGISNVQFVVDKKGPQS